MPDDEITTKAAAQPQSMEGSDAQMTDEQRARDQRQVDTALAEQLEEDRHTAATPPQDDPEP